jgi:hypothetical protein
VKVDSSKISSWVAWLVFSFSFFVSFVVLPQLGYLEVIPFFDWRLFHDSPSTSVFYDIEFEDGSTVALSSGARGQPDKDAIWKIAQNFGRAVDGKRDAEFSTFVKFVRKNSSGRLAPVKLLRITVSLDAYLREPERRTVSSVPIFWFHHDG